MTLLLQLLCIVGFAAIAATTNFKPKNPEYYPAMVSLRTRDNKHFCAGTIISQNWVLTVPECFRSREERNRYTVSVMDYLYPDKGKLHYVERIISPADEHLALVKIRGSFYPHLAIRGFFTPTGLIPHLAAVDIDSKVVAAGYNSSKTQVLGDIAFEVVDTEDGCKSSDVFICARPLSEEISCIVDSGGPVYDPSKKYLVGVITFKNGQCNSGEVERFIRVTTWASWIRSYTKIPWIIANSEPTFFKKWF